ncbi:hypothetical protein [Bradyrhizobium pachyrhizi]|uniref:hypothetical protein n=1 Tax=Bradyrhizobium pachyrhizi TaxID=280333 RepID=UPI00067E18FD|nr:hypothetical protein [Bradyrhizobium pachyrhizi]
MREFSTEPLRLGDTKVDRISPENSFTPEPWMISAYFDDPMRLAPELKRELKQYIARHPLIAKARKLTESRQQAQDELIKRFV